MPSRRRTASSPVLCTALAAAVAVPVTVVVLAAPALADEWSPSAHGYRWSTGPTGPSGSSGLPATPVPDVGGYGSGLQQQSTAASLTGLDTSVATDAEESGLVTISTVIDYGEAQAAGTGIVVSDDGVVVTNHHVVAGATSIQVTDVATGQTYTADLLGASSRKDVAVLQLRGASGLTPASTDSSAVDTGEGVTAVGDAGGDGGDLTAAAGAVTALQQRITVSDEETGARHRLRGLIEVTSDVIPGDSGGALRSADGEVVGMTVAASSGTTSATVSGYVIPWSRVAEVEQAVLAGQPTGDITMGYPAFLGVQLDTRTGTTTIAGVVADSPAATAGLAAGDVVTAVDGSGVTTGDALRAVLATHASGDSVTITWTDRSGASHSAVVALAAGPVA